jgi:hypothetical protein
METIRDGRLGTAMALLQRPRNGRPGYVPLLAGCAFIGAVTFLAYIVTKPPVPVKAAPVKAVAVQKADFELSGNAAEPPVTEAVLLGAEQSR